jgi:polyribonucleotide nucleotidyltransferase
MFTEKVKTINFNGEEIIFKTGKLAPRAESSILAQLGETVVLAIVSMNNKDSDLDYFPLSVEYVEKFYAGGIISGSRFIKRERFPSEDAILKARQVDHSIRSLFPKGFKRDVNVIINVLAYDGIHNPEQLAVTAASMALMNSSIPFYGPSASVVIGIKNNELILNPKLDQEHELDAHFVVSVREDRVLNIEGWGDEIAEEKMNELLDFAVSNAQPLLNIQKEFQQEVGKPKLEYTETSVPQELIDKVYNELKEQIQQGLYDRDNRFDIYRNLQKDFQEQNIELGWTDNQIAEAIEYVARKIMRSGILQSSKRTDDRELEEIRELEIEVGVLPRVHGSALFRRGMTQSLSILTLGSTRLVQSLESFEGEGEKSFMHHYNGPNYSFGQAGRFSYYPGRREIGHGNIGENALFKVLPGTDVFPYTTRVVSEILSQMGSSSMAATCATSLALMDAGVPIKAQVAGISVGLITEDNNESEYKLLVDLADVEDFYGDMDFKVTGTTKGVTAIQLDNKLRGVPVNILKQAFFKSKEARMKILEAMNNVISQPRNELSKYAPKVEIIKIDPSKIGEVIGPAGKVIKGIIEQAGGDVDIDIQDDGQVNITGISKEQRDIALELIKQIVEEPEIGKVYTAKVDKIVQFGAFVNITPAITGLVHVSEMAEGFVKDPNQIVKEGDTVKVKLIKIENGKQSFSMKNVS